MPLYEYRCESCGEREEKLESMSAPERHACPVCGKVDAMARQISVAAFALTGSGVYKAAAKEPIASAAEEASAPKADGCCGGACACH